MHLLKRCQPKKLGRAFFPPPLIQAIPERMHFSQETVPKVQLNLEISLLYLKFILFFFRQTTDMPSKSL